MAIALAFIAAIGFIAVFYFFGQLQHAKNEISFLRHEKENVNNKSEEKINFLQTKLLELEKRNELLSQARQQFEHEKQEWYKDKENLLLQLSEKLMKKNLEQQNEISTYQQENIKKITENLFKNFESVTTKLATLDNEVKKSAQDISQTKSALLSPGGSGRTAEITLENILKSSNLLEKESLNSVGDYILQSHFGSITNNEAKRPDAIIFLPNNQIVIIDSKSSPYFLELAESTNKEETLNKIKNTFRKHLEDLKNKDYARFLFDELRTKDSSDFKIFSVMFLQTEQMLEVIKKADKNFEQKAFAAGIIIATPIALIHLLSNVKFIIDRFKQEKNIELLKIEVGKLLDSLVTIIKDSKEIGKSINKALVNYNKLTRSLNRTTNLSKNICDLGIEGKKSQETKLLEEFIIHDES